MGVTLIVCLLNDYELRTVGVDAKKYEKACDSHNIKLLKHPVIEMAAPPDLSVFHEYVILPLC